MMDAGTMACYQHPQRVTLTQGGGATIIDHELSSVAICVPLNILPMLGVRLAKKLYADIKK